MGELVSRVKLIAERNKTLPGLDGRRLHVRSSHAALNTLLQSAGAIVMKRALCILHAEAKKRWFDFKFVANVHDEIQSEVRDFQAEEFGKLAKQSIIDAGVFYNLRVPLDGDYAIGNNWAETH